LPWEKIALATPEKHARHERGSGGHEWDIVAIPCLVWVM
jgi:hypothetical protein